MITIDACGISCPEPLLMLKNAANTEKEITMLVDSRNALENCVEFAASNRLTADVSEADGVFTIVMKA